VDQRKAAALALLALALVLASVSVPASAQAAGASATEYKGLWIALAIGLPAIAGGYAVAATGSSAISALTEKPELFGNVIIIVALAEGIAIYGLLVAILLLFIS